VSEWLAQKKFLAKIAGILMLTTEILLKTVCDSSQSFDVRNRLKT
jgi:hypothetical protein